MGTLTSYASKSKIRVVVIDSGINTKHPRLIDNSYEGWSFRSVNGEVEISKDITDEIGHGTATTYIIKKMLPSVEIIMIKVFHEKLEVEIDVLLEALDFIYNNLDCHIIHMSLGVTYCHDLSKLEEKCNKLASKNIILVSAFDNNGAISYPAAFDNVIGVDESINCKKDHEFEFIDNNRKVNVRAKGGGHKVPWVSPEYTIQHGASYSAAYISGIIANYINYNNCKGIDEVLKLLKYNAKQIHRDYKEVSLMHLQSYPKIKKAIIFPFNKEVHSLIRFNHLLEFKISGVFDIKYNGNINRQVSEILGINQPNYRIENIEKINWNDDFDTVILGHTDIISEKTGINFHEEMLKKAQTFNKQIFAFERINEKSRSEFQNLNYYYPFVGANNVPTLLFGKMKKIGKPILGVFGTSSSQGKFTLQLTLRDKLAKLGYKIGQLGTEPSSLLYGFNAVYPMGYQSTVEVSGSGAIKVLNNLMGTIEASDPDIIIIGSQSGTIPYSFSNISYLTTPQLEFLVGTCPDAVLLCVNIEDDLDYIKRTISVIEGLVNTKVIGIVIFPLKKQFNILSGIKSIHASCYEIESKKNQLIDSLRINTFILDRDSEINNLVGNVIDYFSS